MANEHQCVARDREYKRHGTLSLMAGIDLLTGQVHACVENRHRSREFIGLLKKLDAAYPADTAIKVIKIILDNHSAHVSKETNQWLAEQRDGRFTFVFTPKHDSWLNLVEGFFSKMARSILRRIRVAAKDTGDRCSLSQSRARSTRYGPRNPGRFTDRGQLPWRMVITRSTRLTSYSPNMGCKRKIVTPAQCRFPWMMRRRSPPGQWFACSRFMRLSPGSCDFASRSLSDLAKNSNFVKYICRRAALFVVSLHCEPAFQ